MNVGELCENDDHSLYSLGIGFKLSQRSPGSLQSVEPMSEIEKLVSVLSEGLVSNKCENQSDEDVEAVLEVK